MLIVFGMDLLVLLKFSRLTALEKKLDYQVFEVEHEQRGEKCSEFESFTWLQFIPIKI